MNLDSQKRQHLNDLFTSIGGCYLLKESLERLWTYHYEGAMLPYLQSWIDQLRWQRLEPFQKLAFIKLDADLYSSTICVLSALKNAIVRGAYIYFDEFKHRNHELWAFDEFIDETGMKFSLVG